jgi:leucyl/phenylalanyl-tRNA--protein transferase
VQDLPPIASPLAAAVWEVRVDTAFDQVIAACSQSRRGVAGTWITPAVQQAYEAWHRAGTVHSIETWIDGQLQGGLYGVSLGKMFFGESMFTRTTDASKIALAYLVGFLRAQGVRWIDCQQQTAHLASLGAAPIARSAFLEEVRRAVAEPPLPWTRGRLDALGQLHSLPLAPAAPVGVMMNRKESALFASGPRSP